MLFIKDNIREKHIWKDVEWGKRKKNYNPKGKDPGNVWLPTKDDGKGKITEHLILNDIDNWKKTVRGGERHAETISNNFELLKLFKELTTLKKTVNVPKDIEDYKVRDINQTKLIKFSEKYRLNI